MQLLKNKHDQTAKKKPHQVQQNKQNGMTQPNCPFTGDLMAQMKNATSPPCEFTGDMMAQMKASQNDSIQRTSSTMSLQRKTNEKEITPRNIIQKQVAPSASAADAQTEATTDTETEQVTDSPTEAVSHTVEGGETLGGIAQQHSTTVAQIMVLNGITDPDLISEGQQINIPAVEAATEATHALENLDQQFLNPLENSNTVLQNLTQIIQAFTNEGHTDDRQLAYIIATTMHETGDTFQAIHEGFGARRDGTDYWRRDYADSGYWGRGFVQLTHENNYENMGDLGDIQVELTDYNEAALLPAISAIVTVHGMTSSTSGENFTGRHLDQYIQSTIDPQTGEEVQGNADWYNARRTVNGTAGAAGISTQAQEINGYIQTFRAGATAGTITKTLAQYLFEDTTFFDDTRSADALRILHGLGHLEEQQSPSFNHPTPQKTQYQEDIRETGDYRYLSNINTRTEREALVSFQQEFNRNHNIVVPLNENGVLDDATYKALMRGGNRIEAGNNIIEYAFGNEVEATNLIEQVYEQYTQGQISIRGLGQHLINYMPTQQPEQILDIFNCLNEQNPNLAIDLAYQMSSNSPSHDELAYFNPEVLNRIQTELLLHPDVEPNVCSDNSVYSIESERVFNVINYEAPEPEFTQHIVESGQTLTAIAKEHNTTVERLLNINNIPNANSITVGQQLRIPTN